MARASRLDSERRPALRDQASDMAPSPRAEPPAKTAAAVAGLARVSDTGAGSSIARQKSLIVAQRRMP